MKNKARKTSPVQHLIYAISPWKELACKHLVASAMICSCPGSPSPVCSVYGHGTPGTSLLLRVLSTINPQRIMHAMSIYSDLQP